MKTKQTNLSLQWEMMSVPIKIKRNISLNVSQYRRILHFLDYVTYDSKISVQMSYVK